LLVDLPSKVAWNTGVFGTAEGKLAIFLAIALSECQLCILRIWREADPVKQSAG